MKRMIKGSKEKIIDLIDIDIIFEYDSYNNKIAATRFVKLFSDPLGNIIDEQAYADYYDFIINSEGVILDTGFDVIRDNVGKNSISHYYYIKAIDDEGNIINDYVYKIRISNHVRPKYQEARDEEELRNMRTDENLVKENLGKSVKARFKNIVVNNEKFKTYDDAEFEVERILKEIRNKIRKSTGR